MPRSSKFIALLTSLAFVIVAAGAAWGQLQARENPRVRGPLGRVGGSCSTNRDRANGEVVVVSKSCGDYYLFNSSAENSPNRDFAVIWLQSNVDPRPGWCATEVKSVIRAPRGSRIEAAKPRGMRTNERQFVTTRLVANANGTADENGVIKNGFVLYPNRVKRELEGHKFKLTWRGRKSKEVAFAMGVEISFPDNEPPEANPRGFVASELRNC